MGRAVTSKIRAALDGMRSLATLGMIFTLGVVVMSPASAQTATVERSAKGAAAANIQVGLYLNVKPDCTSGPLPAIRLLTPPANGTLTIKRGKVAATNYKQCLAIEVPGFVAIYKSKPDFAGVDSTTIEVKYPAGRTEIQRISITVGSGKGGQKI
jgi:hypothetical protein